MKIMKLFLHVGIEKESIATVISCLTTSIKLSFVNNKAL